MNFWRHLITPWLMSTMCSVVSAQAPESAMPIPQTGRVERLAPVASRHVDARHVDVWLPDGYSPARRYQVLYMHDGQMLFDANSTWNRQAWNVDVVLTRLMQQGRIPDTLVVGVWNNGPRRHSEYFPQKFLPHLRPEVRERLVRDGLQGQPRADAYLRFLVEELKPLIDARYATRPGPEHTFVMGSSMGGLISVYAMSEYPQIFGGAAGLSTHWIGSHQANADVPVAALAYLRDHLPDPAGHRLYLDRGTAGLDALYGPAQVMVDQLARDHGYREQGEPANFMSRVYEGADHNELAWADRLALPLGFLLARRPP